MTQKNPPPQPDKAESDKDKDDANQADGPMGSTPYPPGTPVTADDLVDKGEGEGQAHVNADPKENRVT